MEITAEPPITVLLIEDNAADAELIQDLLADGAALCEVDCVPRLSDGLEQLGKRQIDAVLVDLSLPDSRGFDSIEHIRHAAPKLPIVVLTGLYDATLATQALREGAQDYLIKGQIDQRLLLRALRYAIERKRIENERQENEQRYRELLAAATRQAQEMTLLNQVRDALARELDLQATLRTIVEAVAHTFGYSHVSVYLLDGDVSVLQYQVGYARVIERVPITAGVSGRVLRSGQPILVEDVHADPEFLEAVEGLVSEVCVPLFDRDKVVGFLNIESTNGVKLTQADLQLMVALSPLVAIAIGHARLYTNMQQSEARYRAVVEDQTEMICRFLPDSSITFVNQAYCRFMGKTFEELVGQPLLTFMPGSAGNIVEGQIRTFSVAAPSSSFELQIVAPDGQLRWHHWTSRGIFDVYGHLTEIQSIGQDITDRKQAEEKLRSIIEYSTDGIRLIDERDVIIEWNPSNERIVGIPRTAAIGNFIWDIVALETKNPALAGPDFRQQILNILETGHISASLSVIEYGILHLDGTVRTVLAALFPIKAIDGYMIGSIVRDVTALKRAEEQRVQLAVEQQRVLTLHKFIGDATHDLMTPLSIMNTSVYLARKVPDGERRLAYFDKLDAQTARLQTMLEDMLLMSKLDMATSQPSTGREVELDQVIQAVLENHRIAAQEKGQTVIFDTLPHAVRFRLDENDLSIVLSRFLDNAIQYTPVGGMIRLSTIADDRHVGIAITDTGAGIAEADLPYIFDRFYRGQPHRPANSGSGLGLSIARRIVELYGGKIEVESIVGQGSCFRVLFPVAITLVD